MTATETKSPSTANDAKLPMCRGCRDDYYNRGGNSTTGRCWLLENAKVVTRYRLGWWTPPTVAGAFTKVDTLHCHHAPGQYALYEKLPDFITADERQHIESKE
jgi:hypothetical protein